MRVFQGILIAAALAIPLAPAAAAAPTYSNGVVTCPDGSKGSLHVAWYTRPTAAQLSGVCLSLQAKKLQPRPLVNQHPMSREEINARAKGLVGPTP